ncbi:MAG: L,D-transpeptidase [Candidatus Kapaibacterium sp.]
MPAISNKLLWILLLLLIVSCHDDNPRQKISEQQEPEIVKSPKEELMEKLLSEIDTFPLIDYSFIVIRDKNQLDSIRHAFKETVENPALNKMFCTLNRKERRYLKVGDTVLVADSVVNDMTAYSIFPMVYPEAVNIKKLVIVSAAYQAYACYEYGKQVRFAATNTGKEKTQTYPGRYAMVWKQELRISSLDSTWKMPYTWNIHRYAGSAFHKFDMPGYAASHSCLRQFMDDAKWLYYWGEGSKYDTNNVPIHLSGTPVLIIDYFDFRRPKTGPWVALRSNKDLLLELPENPMEYEEAYIPISQIPKSTRGILPDRNRYLHAEDTLRTRGIIRDGVTITVSVDFNELRRKKEAKKLKEMELKKKEEQEAESNNGITDDDIINKNLKKLENNN